MRMVLAAFPDVHFTIEELLVDGNRVILRWRNEGTHEGEFMGIPATGRKGAHVPRLICLMDDIGQK